jgi:hypothetical protein
MGKGLGPTQQAIIDLLPTKAGSGYTTTVIAEKIQRSPRQTRTAVEALRNRGLITVHKQVIWWRGSTRNPDIAAIPVYGALVMSWQSYADWLEQNHRVYHQRLPNLCLQNLDELGINWSMFTPPEEADAMSRAYQDATEARLNRWIAAAAEPEGKR